MVDSAKQDWSSSRGSCLVQSALPSYTKGSSGLPPLEAPVMFAEKRQLFFSFLFYEQGRTTTVQAAGLGRWCTSAIRKHIWILILCLGLMRAKLFAALACWQEHKKVKFHVQVSAHAQTSQSASQPVDIAHRGRSVGLKDFKATVPKPVISADTAMLQFHLSYVLIEHADHPRVRYLLSLHRLRIQMPSTV